MKACCSAPADTTISPVRTAPGLAAAEKVTSPLPLPAVPSVTVSQEQFGTADQETVAATAKECPPEARPGSSAAVGPSSRYAAS